MNKAVVEPNNITFIEPTVQWQDIFKNNNYVIATDCNNKKRALVKCPKCERVIEVTFPDSFIVNEAAMQCECGTYITATGTSAEDAVKNLIKKVEAKEDRFVSCPVCSYPARKISDGTTARIDCHNCYQESMGL